MARRNIRSRNGHRSSKLLRFAAAMSSVAFLAAVLSKSLP